MIMKHKLIQTAAISTLCLACLGGAYGAGEAVNDALGIADARISLDAAVQAAQRHVGGKASRAEYERDQGRWVYDVEVVKGSEVTDVQVDPESGKVLAAVPDKVDQGEDEDHEDRGEAHEVDD